jgi:hypothetical protein
MFSDGMVECSDKQKRHSTMATTSSNYWTATAEHVKPMTEPKEKEKKKYKWEDHKFGLCPGCKVGLDDRADFACSYVNGTDNGIIMCWDCYEKERSSQQVCTNCFHPVNDGDVVIGSLHPVSKQRVVTFCRRC